MNKLRTVLLLSVRAVLWGTFLAVVVAAIYTYEIRTVDAGFERKVFSVRRGMTERQVVAILGRPYATFPANRAAEEARRLRAEQFPLLSDAVPPMRGLVFYSRKRAALVFFGDDDRVSLVILTLAS